MKPHVCTCGHRDRAKAHAQKAVVRRLGYRMWSYSYYVQNQPWVWAWGVEGSWRAAFDKAFQAEQ